MGIVIDTRKKGIYMIKILLRKARTFLDDPKTSIEKYTNPRYKQKRAAKKKSQQKSKQSTEQNTKTSQEYFNEMLTFINAFDVNQLKIDTEYIWPYLRNRIWIQLYALGNDKNKRNISPEEIQKGSTRHVPYYLRDRFKRLYNAKEISEIEQNDTGIDFLFFTVINAAEQVELDDGKVYYRITDPLYEAASKVGTAKKIEMIKVNSPAIRKSKQYYHPAQLILPPYISKAGYTEKLEYHYKFLGLLNKTIPSLSYSYELLDKSLDWEMHTREYYITLLQKLNPRFLFLNGFHHQAPLISAADFLGIKTIDVQHGIQVGWNPLYNHWPEIPEEGYQALPDYFFVWGEKEHRSIREVFKGDKHRPLISGFPWLERQKELTEKLDPKYVKRFKKYKVVTLLALQNQTEVPKLYLDLIAHSSKDHLWIIRHHPKGNRFEEKDFIKQKGERGDILISKYFDKITLAQLFDHIDIVISAGSTVAIEADYHGLYNFIFSEKGKGNYIDEIEDEQFFYIENHTQFYKILDTLDLQKKESRVKAYHTVDLPPLLETLLKEST